MLSAQFVLDSETAQTANRKVDARPISKGHSGTSMERIVMEASRVANRCSRVPVYSVPRRQRVRRNAPPAPDSVFGFRLRGQLPRGASVGAEGAALIRHGGRRGPPVNQHTFARLRQRCARFSATMAAPPKERAAPGGWQGGLGRQTIAKPPGHHSQGLRHGRALASLSACNQSQRRSRLTTTSSPRRSRTVTSRQWSPRRYRQSSP